MEYVKKTWKTGDTITSAALNNIENALAALAAAQEPIEANCTMSEDEGTGKPIITTDLTASELFSAIEAGKFLAMNLAVDEDVIRKIIAVDAQDFDGQFYDFSFITATSDDGVICFLTEHSAEDTVVFRQV